MPRAYWSEKPTALLYNRIVFNLVLIMQAIDGDDIADWIRATYPDEPLAAIVSS